MYRQAGSAPWRDSAARGVASRGVASTNSTFTSGRNLNRTRGKVQYVQNLFDHSPLTSFPIFANAFCSLCRAVSEAHGYSSHDSQATSQYENLTTPCLISRHRIILTAHIVHPSLTPNHHKLTKHSQDTHQLDSRRPTEVDVHGLGLGIVLDCVRAELSTDTFGKSAFFRQCRLWHPSGGVQNCKVDSPDSL